MTNNLHLLLHRVRVCNPREDALPSLAEFRVRRDEWPAHCDNLDRWGHTRVLAVTTVERAYLWYLFETPDKAHWCAYHLPTGFRSSRILRETAALMHNAASRGIPFALQRALVLTACMYPSDPVPLLDFAVAYLRPLTRARTSTPDPWAACYALSREPVDAQVQALLFAAELAEDASD